MLRRILPRDYTFSIVFTLAAAIEGAQDPPDCPGGVPDGLRARLSTEVDNMLAPWNRPGLPGAAVLVVQCGQILHKKSYGLADVVLQRPMAPDTLFELGSITKPFTALAIMMLVERRQLRYDQPLTDLFPDFPPWARQVTLRHLLTHTAGIPEYEELFAASGKLDRDYPRSASTQRSTYEPTSRQGLALLATVQKLRFRPGTRFEYSNSGYLLLAQVVERVSGLRYPEFLRRYVFEPLGMSRSLVYDETNPPLPQRAVSYTWREGVLADVDYTPLNFIYGDGNVQSTVEELALWDQALYSDRLVQAATLQQAFTPGKLRDGKSVEYGFGWHVNHGYGLRRVAHGGSWLGFKNMLVRYPDRRFTVILLSNIEQFDREVLASKIARLYLRDYVVLPKTVALPPDRLAAYAGRYALGAGADYEVTAQDGALWLTQPNGKQHRLAALSRDRFVYEGAEDVSVTFTRARGGRIRSLTRHQFVTELAHRKTLPAQVPVR